jgi:transposase
MTCSREGGLEALRHRPSPGAPRRLSVQQLAQLPTLLQRGPEACGFRGQRWARGRIAAVIQLAFGVSYHPRQAGRLCQVIGWSRKSPRVVPVNATKPRLRTGAATRGRPSKRGAGTATTPLLHR